MLISLDDERHAMSCQPAGWLKGQRARANAAIMKVQQKQRVKERALVE